MNPPEITMLAHDLLEDKLEMSIEFKNLSGGTAEKINLMFHLKAGAQETERQIKEHAILRAKELLARASAGI